MKIKSRLLVTILTNLMLLVPVAQAIELPTLNPHFYFEGDVGYRSLEFANGYGGKIFRSSMPQFTFLLGMVSMTL